MTTASTVLCLCSGGLDSTVVLASLVAQGMKCTAFHVEYGQVSALAEMKAVQEISKHYNVELIIRHIRCWPASASGLLDGGGSSPFLLHRNLQMLLTADVVATELGTDAIALGLCKSVYPDSTAAFLDLARNCLDASRGGPRALIAPLLHLGKRAIGFAAGQKQVPLGLTISCHRATDAACGHCEGCADRALAEEGFREAGAR